MIERKDIYQIVATIVPLYVAMLLGHGSIRWWKIFTPDQSSAINRYVAMFAIPLLTFNFISPINPYHINPKFIAADTFQKIVTLGALFLWSIITRHDDGIDWIITLFSLSTLPNTLLVGVPIMSSMYGEFTTPLLIQIVLLQGPVWYNVLLFLYEYRAAKLLISKQFEGFKISSNLDVESNVGSLNDSEPLQRNNSSLSKVVPYFDGVEMLKIKKKRFWKSKSCSDIDFDERRLNLMKSTFLESLNGVQEKIYEIGVDREVQRAGLDVNTRHAHAANRIGSVDLETVDNFEATDVFTQKSASLKGLRKFTNMTSVAQVSRDRELENGDGNKNPLSKCKKEEEQIPPSSSMTKLILSRVWKKLIRNPNIHAALLGITWALVSSRWNIKLPSIISGSIKIMSNTGLGVAMFSLGIFMALQPKIIACGNTLAAISIGFKFLIGPAVMAATSYAVGIRGVPLQVSIVQAAIPEGIVPFVFGRQYNLHAEILSTAVIFGLGVGLPITIIYYVLLGL